MTLLNTASLEEIREVAARICRDYLTGRWKCITADEIEVKRISGGLSNFLYHVSLPEDATNAAHRTRICSESIASGNVENSFVSHATIAERAGLTGSGRKRNRSHSGEVMSGATTSYTHNSHSEEPREVLLRVYGQTHGENALEAMITESVVFALLSERNFGPKLHGIFPGGRLEQYIKARPLTTTQLSDYKISMKIAEKMGEIHSLNIPMSKEPDWLWNCMERWLKSISSILEQPVKENAGSSMEEVRKINFWREIKWLKSIIECVNFPVVFCHNDLQEGNILLRESEKMLPGHISLSSLVKHYENMSSEDMNIPDEEPSQSQTDNLFSLAAPSNKSTRRRRCSNDNDDKNAFGGINSTCDTMFSSSRGESEPDLIIIDFEYCAYNYRGFDLANHFLEWTLDYSNPEFPYYYHHKQQYPTQQQRHNFIISYLKKLNDSDQFYEASMSEVLTVDREVQIFSMFSHLFWTLWSVVNTTSNIEFGYWSYALTRAREYKQLKEEYLRSIT